MRGRFIAAIGILFSTLAAWDRKSQRPASYQKSGPINTALCPAKARASVGSHCM
jgi:hypothetical protein